MDDSNEGDWHVAGAADALADGDAQRLDCGKHCIAVFNVNGRLHAISDICTHEHARLSDGYVEGETVECPLHQGLFHIPTGRALAAPAVKGLRTFPVRVRAGRIEVLVRASDDP